MTNNTPRRISLGRCTPRWPVVPGSHELVVTSYRLANKAGLGLEVLTVAAKAGTRPVRLEARTNDCGEVEMKLGMTGEPRQIQGTHLTIQRIFGARSGRRVDADPERAAPAATHKVTVRTVGLAQTMELLGVVAAYTSLTRLEIADLSDGDALVPVYETNAWMVATSRPAHANFTTVLNAWLRRNQAAGLIAAIHDDWSDPGLLGPGGDEPPQAPNAPTDGPFGGALAAAPAALPMPEARKGDEPGQLCDLV